MFAIDSNAEQVMRAITRVWREDLANVADTKKAFIKQVVSASVRRHFEKLQFGGSHGDRISNVRWSTERHPYTKEERALRGRGDMPLLQASSEPYIMNAFLSPSAFVVTTRSPFGSTLSYGGGGNPFVRAIAARNQLGGLHVAEWPHIIRNKRPMRQMIDFPARPFLFWDEQMTTQIAKIINDTFVKAVHTRRPA